MKKNKLNSYNSQYFLAYILIAPAVIYLLCIVGWPLIETFRLSFTNSSIAGEDYVGFENYEKLLSSSKFSTCKYNCTTVLASTCSSYYTSNPTANLTQKHVFGPSSMAWTRLCPASTDPDNNHARPPVDDFFLFFRK